MAGTEHVDNILKRLASGSTASRETSQAGTAATQILPIESRTIVELAHLSLNRFVDDTAPSLIISGGGDVPQKNRIPMQTGADADLTALVRIQEERIRALTELNELAVSTTEDATLAIRGEEKSVRSWAEAKIRTLEEQRQQWYARAEKLVEEKGSQMATGRLAVEQEWNDLAQRLPQKSRSRLLMQANIPIVQRAELTAGGASESMVSRARRNTQASEEVQNVHWKMRASVDNLINQRVAQTRNAAREATKSLSRGAVTSARNRIHNAHTQYRASETEAQRRVSVLEQALRTRNVPYQHLMAHCAERVRCQREPLLLRLRNLV